MPKAARKRKDKTEDHYFEKDGKKVHLAWQVNHSKNETIYFVHGNCQKFIQKIHFKNFLGIPTGLYLNKDGWGFPGHTRGYYFLEVLTEALPGKKSIELVIKPKGKSGIKKSSSKVLVTFNIEEFRRLIAKLKLIHNRSISEVRDMSASFLSEQLKTHLSVSAKEYDSYKPGEVHELLKRNGIQKKLNEEDINAIVEFFPKVFKSAIKGRTKLIKDLKIRLAKEGKKITDKVYLDEVIAEFERKLDKNPANEGVWQLLLKEKVLPFLNNTKIIDRENISLEGQAPDFVLVDVYGFADIVEIKTPATSLLTYDGDHKNYFWSSPMSEAISQTENYLDIIKDNQSEYVKLVKKKFDTDLSLTRPRGYVIAGTSELLKDKKAREDYRRLRSSHKNIEFILYDELLENLQHIQSKLDK